MFVVGPVATLEQAFGAIRRERLDAALLDVRLSGHDVYAVADALMTRGIPFMFVSALTQKQMPARYRQCAYIGKPFSPDRIGARAQALPRRRGSHRR